MKKLFLIAALLIVTAATFAQKPYIIQTVADTNEKFTKQMFSGQFMYNSAGTKYRLRVSPTGVLSIVAVP